jgi:hypothetical protein
LNHIVRRRETAFWQRRSGPAGTTPAHDPMKPCPLDPTRTTGRTAIDRPKPADHSFCLVAYPARGCRHLFGFRRLEGATSHGSPGPEEPFGHVIPEGEQNESGTKTDRIGSLFGFMVRSIQDLAIQPLPVAKS